MHLIGKKRLVSWLVNNIYVGTRFFGMKRSLLKSIGYKIGENVKIVGPIECTGTLIVGDNCWIGKNFKVNGNGTVVIGNNCDIGPEVTFMTGGHEIGTSQRRAGQGFNTIQTVGNGVWIGGRATIVNKVHIGDSSVIAACACVVQDVDKNTLVGGVPAKKIRSIENV